MHCQCAHANEAEKARPNISGTTCSNTDDVVAEHVCSHCKPHGLSPLPRNCAVLSNLSTAACVAAAHRNNIESTCKVTTLAHGRSVRVSKLTRVR